MSELSKNSKINDGIDKNLKIKIHKMKKNGLQM